MPSHEDELTLFGDQVQTDADMEDSAYSQVPDTDIKDYSETDPLYKEYNDAQEALYLWEINDDEFDVQKRTDDLVDVIIHLRDRVLIFAPDASDAAQEILDLWDLYEQYITRTTYKNSIVSAKKAIETLDEIYKLAI